MDAEPVVCACFQITLQAIRKTIGAGAVSTAEIGVAVRAGTNCGSCLPELKRIVARERLAHPSESAAPRMRALARLPVFLSLAGRHVAVAGGSAAAAWKAEPSRQPAPSLTYMPQSLAMKCWRSPRIWAEAIAIHRRAWLRADFDGAALAVGAIEDEIEAARFAAAARAAGAPFNVVDRPAHCDFAFGAIVNRSPLVIGISTDGAAPVFAQAIRARLEALLPQGFARWAEAAQRWRQRLAALNWTTRARRRFWEHFAARAFELADVSPGDADFTEIARESKGDGGGGKGRVTLVGAGPGDPGLLTLNAVRALQSADVILFDDLVSTEVLEFARREAKRSCSGRLVMDRPAARMTLTA